MPEALKLSKAAANVPLPGSLKVTHGAGCLPPTGSTAGRLPPTGSTAGSALSPTPPQGGSDTGAPYVSLMCKPNMVYTDSPPRGE